MDEKCNVCGTEYETYKVKLEPDSHFRYTEYYPCPTCKYTGKIEVDIKEALENKTVLKFNPGKPITMNTEELTDIILESIEKNWPKPTK
jgi:hypothetical protein